MSNLKKLFLAFLGMATLSAVLMCAFPSFKYNLRDPRYLGIKKFIFSSEKVDFIFLGSSQIWTAVDTPFLNSQQPKKTINLGVNWHGDQIRTILGRDILERKLPEKLVLEIHSFNDVDEHPYFKFLATGADLINYSSEHLTHLTGALTTYKMRDFAYFLSLITRAWIPFSIKGIYFALREIASFTPSEELTHDGYLPQRGSSTYERTWEKTTAQEKDKPSPAIQSLAKLCREKKVGLYFLFVPQYKEPAPSGAWVETLAHYGTPLIIPNELLYKPENWFNNEHLNQKGARQFSEKLLASTLFLEKKETPEYN